MKKILFVINDATFFISHRLPIAQKLIEEGHEVHLATSGEALPIYNEVGLKFHKIRISRQGKRPLSELRLIWQLFKLFTKIKPDLAHLVTIKPYLYGGIVAKIAKVPAVVSAVSVTSGKSTEFKVSEMLRLDPDVSSRAKSTLLPCTNVGISWSS